MESDELPPVEPTSVDYYVSPQLAEPEPPIQPPLPKKGLILLPWIAILAIVGLIMFAGTRASREADTIADEGGPDVMLELQGKYLVGLKQLSPTEGGKIYDQAGLRGGSVTQRLSLIILTGEMLGPAAASENLEQLSEVVASSKRELPPWQSAQIDTLTRLYQDHEKEAWNAPSVSEEERNSLNQRLGWFGLLAITPDNSPLTEQRKEIEQSAMIVTAALVFVSCVGLVLGSLGFFGGLMLFGFAISGRLRSRLDAGAPHGGVYAETFAIWMILFILLGIGVELAGLPPAWGLPLQGVAMFGSLLALLWPVLRGIPWRSVAYDIGWTRPPKWYEPALGVACHLCTAPLLLIGLLLTLGLMGLVGLMPGEGGDPLAPVQAPTHPVVNWIGEAGWAGKLAIFVLACIAAPVVEETMFRGVLYRHLRDATASWRIAASVAFSALVNGVVFAAIHPQGVVAIPMLTAIAVGFSLSREWRGSLVAPMTAHAFNNGVLMLMMFALI